MPPGTPSPNAGVIPERVDGAPPVMGAKHGCSSERSEEAGRTGRGAKHSLFLILRFAQNDAVRCVHFGSRAATDLRSSSPIVVVRHAGGVPEGSRGVAEGDPRVVDPECLFAPWKGASPLSGTPAGVPNLSRSSSPGVFDPRLPSDTPPVCSQSGAVFAIRSDTRRRDRHPAVQATRSGAIDIRRCDRLCRCSLNSVTKRLHTLPCAILSTGVQLTLLAQLQHS